MKTVFLESIRYLGFYNDNDGLYNNMRIVYRFTQLRSENDLDFNDISLKIMSHLKYIPTKNYMYF